MASMLETPSRIWRRIEVEGSRDDMPSLPSVPGFDDSGEDFNLSDALDLDDSAINPNGPIPIHSTPAAASHHSSRRSSIRAASSTSSASRFANSIAKLSNTGSINSRRLSTRPSSPSTDSFDISAIPSLPPGEEPYRGTSYFSGAMDEDAEEDEESKDSIPERYLPKETGEEDDQDASLSDALESISRATSPFPAEQDMGTPREKSSYIDYQVPLKSASASPFDKFRNVNIAPRRLFAERTRTPSLSRTTLSPASSPGHSTPKSSRSIALSDRSESPIPEAQVPLPRSNNASPAIARHSPEPEESTNTSDQDDSGAQSMDITDVHISPLRQFSPSDDDERNPLRESSRSQRTGSLHSSIDEPTFSTDEGPTPYAQMRTNLPAAASPVGTGLASAFPSPSPSLATPTPAFPGLRARFNLPVPSQDCSTPAPADRQYSTHHDSDASQDEDPLTPKTRRRSFFLSVINSTARPRIKAGTPHPRSRIPPDTPSVSGTPGPSLLPSVQDTPGPLAFAGTTPRPRFGLGRRMSHPLSQGFTTSSAVSESEAGAESASPSATTNGHVPWSTPGPVLQTHSQLSPYDELGGNQASFISTASSHDLTTNPRANTSFDPAMGFGVGQPGQGVGRFNAGKLNNYLHGLNRRLQEENELLMQRLRHLEEKGAVSSGSVPATPSIADGASRRLSGDRRRISTGTTLGDLEEVAGEGWQEEKAELEEMVETFKSEIEKCMQEKEEVEKVLEDEKNGRERDKERWKGRMAEVESGVEEIVKDLETRWQDAEQRAKLSEQSGSERIKELEKELHELEAQRDHALERVQRAEQALEEEQDLGGELRNANERISNLMENLRNANNRIKELEEEVFHSDERINQLEDDLKSQQDANENLLRQLDAKDEEIQAQRTEVQHLEKLEQKLSEELQATKTFVAELEGDAGAAVEQLEALETELAATKGLLEDAKLMEEELQARSEQWEKKAEASSELSRQMEEALDAAEKKMLADEETVAELRGRIATLEQEKERQRDLSARSINASHHAAANPAHEAEVESLEEELDDANKEIARLNTILAQSPARKAMDKAKDTKIEMLEKENEVLSERIKAMRVTMSEVNTPTNKIVNSSSMSPLARRALSMSIRAPKTPGGPLRELSWLNTTMGDHSVSPLVAEISRLQRELDKANESIDDKIDQLEDAGLGIVGMTKNFEDARAKIRALEDEIARLSRKEERRLNRLGRARCQKCRTKVDLRGLIHVSDDESFFYSPEDSLPTEPPTPPTKTSEALRANLRSVNSHLEEMREEWASEKRELLGEKAVLQDAAKRLNSQIREAKSDANKATELQRAESRNQHDELDKAKRTIVELESDLKAERSRLRALSTEQTKIDREKEGIFLQLQRTESDMDEIRSQLQACKKENRDMENELRTNANAEQKARLLETRVAENVEAMEQLREERGLLAAEHKKLQERFSEVSEQANRLGNALAKSQKHHDDHRHQLDLHMSQIEDLQRALSDRSGELHRVEAEKARISAEKDDVAQTVAALEADLRRVKKDAQAFGRDLKQLRAEKEKLELKHHDEQVKAERIKKQTQTQIRLLNEEVESQRVRAQRAKEQLEKHVCVMDGQQLSALKLQHNKECKGLFVQIRYLKAKFTRESTLRFDMVYQKRYLLELLGQLEKSERAILASIANIGFPAQPSPPKKPRNKLKTAAMSIIFISRMRRVSEEWRKQCASKQAIAAALSDARQRRAVKGS
ncbi:hypothetical protein D9758_008042 [Tetrapyrgos nigripes]|uniref:Pericentrin/AKAP-450 centrosomal targeting domain-containing protein n=1 Tax=Tetrapyrgos nigripes TaxID=182062 RepID=A0A8H5D257_9AGAR|nr:hypothetical protein D9758_008042 [Tetrapyrgos nigripes]